MTLPNEKSQYNSLFQGQKKKQLWESRKELTKMEKQVTEKNRNQSTTPVLAPLREENPKPQL
jgi:hypothetical protein